MPFHLIQQSCKVWITNPNLQMRLLRLREVNNMPVTQLVDTRIKILPISGWENCITSIPYYKSCWVTLVEIFSSKPIKL